jgi:hypothetical protein
VYTSVTKIFFSVCVLCWMVAYVLVVYRGFRDRAYGIPMAALAANLSWEFIWSFVLDPYSDLGHVLAIPWFAVDLVIAWQCWTYGGNHVAEPFLRRNFRKVFVAAVAVAFPILYLSFQELHDTQAQYTGSGINLMMSLLFVSMLLNRTDVAGQSMYIAVFKWLGTFFAWIAAGLHATTTVEAPWPSSLASFVTETARHGTYPLTPLINTFYLVTFLVDILYAVLLRARLRSAGVPPWRRA